ncbi:MAG TPA: hypothetical protein VHX86_09400 [Tepidisphaeraceae bacterium]|jgi:hypothetical protein|nr:hypothetical protein [Tepidisphaeraceae bacterium]
MQKIALLLFLSLVSGCAASTQKSSMTKPAEISPLTGKLVATQPTGIPTDIGIDR